MEIKKVVIDGEEISLCFNTDEENAAICYRSETVKGLSSPWDDENVRIMQTSAGSGGQFFTLTDIKKFTKAVLEKDKRLYSAKWFDIAEQEHSPKCSKEARGLGWLIWWRMWTAGSSTSTG